LRALPSFASNCRPVAPEARITPEKIAACVEVMRSNVLNGEVPFRRAYIRSVIDRVDVDDAEIQIIGRKTVLERFVMGGGHAPAGVPSLVRKWRPVGDSNPCYQRERLVS
jgi:site-specific DNA recombinase